MLYSILRKVGDGFFVRPLALLFIPLLPIVVLLSIVYGIARDVYDTARYDWYRQVVALVTISTPEAFRYLLDVARTGVVPRR